MKKIFSSILLSLLIVTASFPLAVISAHAEENRININITSSSHGSATPSGSFTVASGETINLKFYPDSGYITESFTISRKYVNSYGETVTKNTVYDRYYFGKTLSSSYNITVSADCNIYVNFVPSDAELRNINITHEGEGFGTAGTESYFAYEGAYFRDFICDIQDGYEVSTVIVDGEIMYNSNDKSTYELLDWYNSDRRDSFNFLGGQKVIKADTNIRIIYKKMTSEYLFSYVTGDGGNTELTSSNAVLPDLSGKTFATLRLTGNVSIKATFTANEGYVIDKLYVNNALVSDASGLKSFSSEFNNINRNITINVTFRLENIVISLSCSGNGRLSMPVGDYEPEQGETLTVSFLPDEGYAIERVIIDGIENNEAKLSGFYTFENIDYNHSLFVQFTVETKTVYTAAVSYGEHGSVTPSGKLSVTDGGYISLSLMPESGYRLSSINVNGSDIDNPIGCSYFIKNIHQNMRIYVSFEKAESNSDIISGTDTDIYSESDSNAVYGDADGNGKVRMEDVVLMQKYVAKLTAFDVSAKNRSDVNANGTVEMSDIVLVQRFIAKLITSFPAENKENNGTDTSGNYTDSESSDSGNEDLQLLSDYKLMLNHEINILRSSWEEQYSNQNGEYNGFSYAQFMSAYSNAVFVYNDAFSTLKQLKKGYDELIYAVKELQPDVDKMAVSELISILNLDISMYGSEDNSDSKYTDDTFMVYYAALKEACAIIESPYSYTNQEIWDADTNLAEAYENLKYNIIALGKDKAYPIVDTLLSDYEYLQTYEQLYTQRSYKRFISAYEACTDAVENYDLYSLSEIADLYYELIEAREGLIYLN